MSGGARWLLALFSLLLAAPCQAQSAHSDDHSAQVERQILVMLRLPPAHFRPGASYAGNYDVLAGREARRRTANELARDYNLTLVSAWPMPALGVDCYVMQVADGANAAQVADAISHDARAEWAQPMGLFRSLGHDDPLYSLQPAASAWHIADLHRISTGRRVVVAAIDSGVELSHPDLVGQVVAAENLIAGSRYRGEMHGTAVAGIVAAIADNHAGVAGIAPGARLLALRACWQNGDSAECSSFTLARALQLALDRSVRVINLSVAGPEDRLLAKLLDVAIARGITIVTAVDPDREQGGFPALHPGVLAVGVDESKDVPWLLAPGRDIPTTLPGARWGFVSGSSFAAAHVSGLVALILEFAPALKPSQVRAALSAVAVDAGTAASSQRVGRIDACAVFTRLTGSCTCSCSPARNAEAYTPQ